MKFIIIHSDLDCVMCFLKHFQRHCLIIYNLNLVVSETNKILFYVKIFKLLKLYSIIR